MDQIVGQIEPLEKRAHLAWWNLSTTGEEKYAEELKQAKTELKTLFSSKELYQKLQQGADKGREREKKLLLNQFKENQIPPSLIEEIVALETQIESIYTNFRAVVDGKELANNDLKQVLTTSLDSSYREKVWRASKEIGEKVEGLVLKLVALRNRAALSCGYPDYYTMSLDLQELNQEELFALLEQVKKKTDPLFESYKQELDVKLLEKFKVERLFPWHYEDPFFQEAPKGEENFDAYYAGKDIVEISRRFFEEIGLGVEDVLKRSDLFERAHKNQHAFCTCIDRKADVRILCNIRDNEYWMGTQLHELGHAVYDKFIDSSLPYLLRTTAHTSTTEAIAMIFGRLSKEASFIQKYAGMRASSSSQIASNLLVFARWVLVMVHFERDLYQGRNLDLNRRWWEYVEQFQRILPPKEFGDRYRNKPDWAAKLHLACAPVYYQNYLLGEMTASHLKHYIGDLLSPSAGSYLKNRLFALGASYPWDETLLKVTGEKLNPDYFIKDLMPHKTPS